MFYTMQHFRVADAIYILHQQILSRPDTIYTLHYAVFLEEDAIYTMYYAVFSGGRY